MNTVFWQFIITLCITIAGWCVVHFLSAQRDKKKEWRGFARETALLVDKIEIDAILYHTSKNRDEELEWELKSSIDKLDTQVQLIKRHLNFKYDISFFRAAITLHNFQDNNFTKQKRESCLIQDITWNALQIKEHLFNAE